MPKYSFLMPYLDRIPQFRTTLESFQFHKYDPDAFEIVVVEDAKTFRNREQHANFKKLIGSFPFQFQTLVAGGDDCWNPGPAFNAAAQHAEGEYLILTNPECAHKTNVLEGLDRHFDQHPDSYAVCACLSVLADHMSMTQLQTAVGKWYQHSKERNALVHFCSALKKDLYISIGGFDENYRHGVCFEDDDFRNRVIQAKIPFAVYDDLVTVHLDHYKTKPPEYLRRHRINKAYFEKVWGVHGFTAEMLQVGIYKEDEPLPYT